MSTTAVDPTCECALPQGGAHSGAPGRGGQGGVRGARPARRPHRRHHRAGRRCPTGPSTTTSNPRKRCSGRSPTRSTTRLTRAGRRGDLRPARRHAPGPLARGASGATSRATATRPASWASSSRPRCSTTRCARPRRSGSRRARPRWPSSIRQLQRRGLADPELDPVIAAAALGSMTSRFAEFWLAQGERRLRLRGRRRHGDPPVRQRTGSRARFVITTEKGITGFRPLP